MKGGRDMEARPRSEEQTRGSHQSTPLYLEISHHSARWERRSHWGFFVFFSAFFSCRLLYILRFLTIPHVIARWRRKRLLGFLNLFYFNFLFVLLFECRPPYILRFLTMQRGGSGEAIEVVSFLITFLCLNVRSTYVWMQPTIRKV